jgi:hypothetical protein
MKFPSSAKAIAYYKKESKWNKTPFYLRTLLYTT